MVEARLEAVIVIIRNMLNELEKIGITFEEVEPDWNSVSGDFFGDRDDCVDDEDDDAQLLLPF